MRVLFCTSKLPGAVLIRAITWSDWSHVALIDGEEAIEATWPAVRVAPLADVLAKHSRHTVADIPCQDLAAVIAAARSQIGKPYDLTALFGMLARRDWQEADRLVLFGVGRLGLRARRVAPVPPGSPLPYHAATSLDDCEITNLNR